MKRTASFGRPFDKLMALSLSKGSINPEQTAGLGPGKVEGLICVTSKDDDRDGSEGSSMDTDNNDNNMDMGMDNNLGSTGTRSNAVQGGVADGIPY